MTRSLKKAALCFAAILFALPNAGAQSSVAFGYADKDYYNAWGTQKRENYDVCVALDHPDLIGKKIVGLRVPAVTNSTSNYSGWIATRLRLKTVDGERVNDPNIASKQADLINGELFIKFDEPYEITEKGAYVGYSFSVDQFDTDGKKPLMVVKSTNPGGFWIRTSVTLTTWEEQSAKFNLTSPIVVMLQGEFPDSKLDVTEVQYTDGKIEVVPAAPVEVVNRSCKAIEQIDYEYTIGKETFQTTYDLPEAIPAQWGRRAVLRLPLKVCERGIYPLSVKVTKVNGQDNISTENQAGSTLAIHNEIPEHRPVIEEFTGTWCGFCPRGWKGMEMMAELYGDDFIAICYHDGNSDPMAMKAGYPSFGLSLPSSMIDREYAADPYYGSSKEPLGIEKDWLTKRDEFSPAIFNLKAEWDATDINSLKCTSALEWSRLPLDADPAHYRVEYVLVADGLCGDSSEWIQTNYYINDKAFTDDPNLAEFVNAGTSQLRGFIYNDVAVLTSGLSGVAGSVNEIEAGKEYTHSYTFDIQKAVNKDSKLIVQDRLKLKVVAMLLNVSDGTYGKVVNAAKAYPINRPAGIDSVQGQPEVVASEWFDLAGNRVAKPANGIYINRLTLSDGQSKTRKAVVK